MFTQEYRDRFPRTLEEAFGPYTSHHIIDLDEVKRAKHMRSIYFIASLFIAGLACVIWG